jgi:hypothetical protein
VQNAIPDTGNASSVLLARPWMERFNRSLMAISVVADRVTDSLHANLWKR